MIVALIASALAAAAAFGLPLSAHQSDAILTLAGGVATLSFAHGLTGFLSRLNGTVIAGFVSAAIGVAVAFGLPITPHQTETVLTLVGVLSGVLLTFGGAEHVVVAHHVAKAHAGHLGPGA